MYDVFVWANSNITTVLFFDSRLSTPHGQGNTLEQLKCRLEQITDYGRMMAKSHTLLPKFISQPQIDIFSNVLKSLFFVEIMVD